MEYKNAIEILIPNGTKGLMELDFVPYSFTLRNNIVQIIKSTIQTVITDQDLVAPNNKIGSMLVNNSHLRMDVCFVDFTK